MFRTNSAARLGFPVLLLLAVCTFSLAVHFVAENIHPAASPVSYEVAGRGGHPHIHEQGEEQFIFPILSRLPSEWIGFIPGSPAAVRATSFSASPLLPPPNS